MLRISSTLPRPLLLGLLAAALATGAGRADEPDDAAVAFFEKEVRPLLVSRCQECHGPTKQKGGLRLDSRASALAGGDSGAAVVPGDLEQSLLIDAVNYGDLYQMPPKTKLPAGEIAILTRWVQMGAPWPAEAAVQAQGDRTFDLEARRRKHWSFQPVKTVAVPAVGDASWPINAIDRFVLAKLEANGLKPAPDADRRTLIRRLSFDLIGLPPSPEDVEAFVADDRPEAYEILVDRLLASPHHGERWGRHWLDLVRYAETAGHEFDYDILGAYRYRDYVIRALNDGVPYDQFLVEHVAGDLLENPRRNPADGSNESILATGFYFLGEGTHSPVDVREDEVRRIDNQIEVLTKTFQGLTVACARCHDHKFDAISTRDYYALAGYLQSSRFHHAFIDAPERFTDPIRAIEDTQSELRRLWYARAFEAVDQVAEHLLLASRQEIPEGDGSSSSAATVRRFLEELCDEVERGPEHPLHAWSALFGGEVPGEPEQRKMAAIERLTTGKRPESVDALEPFDRPGFPEWFPAGYAFGSGPSRAGDLRVESSEGRPVATVVPRGFAHSGLVADRLRGILRSRTFTIQRKYLHYLASGSGGRINLIIDGFEKIRSPIYGELAIEVNQPDRSRWYAQDVSMWVGHRAYIEISDGASVDFTRNPVAYTPGDGFVAVGAIRASDEREEPEPESRFAADLFADLRAVTPEALAARYEEVLRETLRDCQSGSLTGETRDRVRVEALNWFLRNGLIRVDADPQLLALLERIRSIAAAIPEANLAPAITDGTGEDESVMIRGNHKNLGQAVPRRFLEALADQPQPSPGQGSGRLELARRMTDPSNPLTARVMVNRLWKHHFVEGLVTTPDDFGAMGQPPSHPELLDYLAAEFIRSGWSIKAMHRLMVGSRAYRMRSNPTPEAEAADPNNRMLHRMNVRRLEAEAVRDAILAVSGRLDRTLFGPAVPTHLTPFMEGRGRPAVSGPLDGAGRRSLYLDIRRNFLNPMLLAFDFPSPATTVGKRNVSNVPAQALILLNDPFVIEQASAWAGRTLDRPHTSTTERLDRLYREAFARPPRPDEVERAVRFLEARGADRRAWSDLCHVLINVKEFVFIP